MDRIDKQGYRENVGIIVTDSASRVLIGGRTDKSGWQFPQGGIKQGETAEKAMYRELHEEIGLGPDDVETLGLTKDWLKYRYQSALFDAIRHQFALVRSRNGTY